MALAKRITGPPLIRENWEQRLEEEILFMARTPQVSQLEMVNPIIQDLIMETNEPHTCGEYKIQMMVGHERIEYAGRTQFPSSYDPKNIHKRIMGGVLSNHERSKFLLKAAEHTGIIQVTLDKIMKTAKIDYRET